MFELCDVCLNSIFEVKMMVKIVAILMPFSNSACHFRATADFTHGKSGDGNCWTTWIGLSYDFLNAFS